MATPIETNQSRHRSNLEILKGRHAGEYMEDGQPRGGGGPTIIEELYFYEAVFISMEEVFNVHGLNDTGTRTPHEELHPATVVRPIRRKTKFITGGRPVVTTEILLDA